MAKNREVVFDIAERARLARACQTLGIRFEEFIHRAVLHALDEFEADAREAIRNYQKETK